MALRRLQRVVPPQKWTVTFASQDRIQSWVNGSILRETRNVTSRLTAMRPASSKTGLDFVYDPCTNDALFAVEHTSKETVDLAISTAKSAQQAWKQVNGLQRGRILRKAAELLRERSHELALIEALDSGRPISETSIVDIQSAIDCFDYFAGLAPAMSGQHMDLGGDQFGYTRRESLGVCAGIGAWNYPIQSAAWKAGPALAFGNALIFKPSEETPLTALALAEILKEAGLPDGLFSVLLGSGDIGRQLSEHSDIAKVSFTGSRDTGLKVQQSCSTHLKRTTLELGGKSPLIVFNDANFEQAIRGALMANFFSNGQVCSNGTRVFVHKDMVERFTQELVSRAGSMRVGDSLNPESQVTSLINPQHVRKVQSYVEKGLAEGASLLLGGKTSELYPNAFLPTIFGACQDDMTIVRDEIFGPVMCVLSFDDEDEVVSRANETEFGLSAGVFTRDVSRAHRVIAKLQAGTTWINDYNLAPVEMPWGGYKQSGLGRENGADAINHWTQLKSVVVNTGEVWCPF